MIYHSLEFKIANERDIYSLVPLFKSVFNKDMSKKELAWRYISNPYITESLYNSIALNQSGEIVGHTGFIPNKYKIGNITLRGGLTVGSAVKKEYASIFPKLHSNLEHIVISNFDFLYGFPNNNSKLFFQKYFKYSSSYFSLMQLDKHNITPNNASFKFDSVISGINNEIAEEYLYWRIYSSPLTEYEEISTGNFNLIFKRYINKQVDILCIIPKGDTFYLDEFSNTLLKITNTSKINIYSTDKNFSNLLKMAGFRELDSPNSFVYKIVNDKVEIDNFFLQMIDNDIF